MDNILFRDFVIHPSNWELLLVNFLTFTDHFHRGQLQQPSDLQDFKVQQISFIIVILKMVERSFNNIPVFVGIPDLKEVSHIAEGRDLESLIFASIETLKSYNKRGKEEVFHLV